MTETMEKHRNGRAHDPKKKFKVTIPRQGTEQATLLKQDEMIDLLNAQASSASEMLAIDSDASSGGNATETMTVTGLLESDEILSVTQKTAGGNGTAVVSYDNQADDALDITWTADPGAGAVIQVMVKRAAPGDQLSKVELDL